MPPQQPGEPYRGGDNHDNEPPKKKSHKLAIALGGVSAAAVIGIGSSIFGLSSGSDDEHHAPGVNNSSSENSVIFGEACQNRSDHYGLGGVINTDGSEWDSYVGSSNIPDRNLVVSSLKMREENLSGSDRVFIDPNSLTTDQGQQLYDSYTAYMKEKQSTSVAEERISVYLYGDIPYEPQVDGEVDSPDLNVCVSYN